MEIIENKHKLNEINEDLKNLNFKKLNLKLYIREIYLKMLKNDDDALKDNGLIWLVKSFWNINDDVPFEFFPKIIDQETFSFIKDVHFHI